EELLLLGQLQRFADARARGHSDRDQPRRTTAPPRAAPWVADRTLELTPTTIRCVSRRRAATVAGMRLALVCLLLFTGIAGADVHKAKAGKVSIAIPKNWQVDAKDDLIRAASPSGEVAFFLWVVDSPDLKAALVKLEGELYSSVK